MPDRFIKPDQNGKPRVLQTERDRLTAEQPFDPASELHDALLRAIGGEQAAEAPPPEHDLSRSSVYQAWQRFKLDIFEPIVSDLESSEVRIEFMVAAYDDAEDYMKKIILADIEEKKARIGKLRLLGGFAEEFQECFENLLELEQQGDDIRDSLNAVLESIRHVFPDPLYESALRKGSLAMAEADRDRAKLLFRQREEIVALRQALESIEQQGRAEAREVVAAREKIAALEKKVAELEAAHALTRHLEKDEAAVRDALERANTAERTAQDATRRAELAERRLENELDLIAQEKIAQADLAKRVLSAEARAEAFEAELEQLRAEAENLRDVKARLEHVQAGSGGTLGANAQAQIAALQAKLAENQRILHEKDSHIEHLTIERDVLAKLPQIADVTDRVGENHRLLTLIADRLSVSTSRPFADSSRTVVQPMNQDDEDDDHEDVYDFFESDRPSTAAKLPGNTSGDEDRVSAPPRTGATDYKSRMQRSLGDVFSKHTKTAAVPMPEQLAKAAGRAAPQPEGEDGSQEPDQPASGAVKPFTSRWDG